MNKPLIHFWHKWFYVSCHVGQKYTEILGRQVGDAEPVTIALRKCYVCHDIDVKSVLGIWTMEQLNANR